MLGTYTPKSPSEFFVTRMNEINIDLNQKEGISVPNPYYQVLPSILDIINKNRGLNLLNENVNNGVLYNWSSISGSVKLYSENILTEISRSYTGSVWTW